MPGGRGPVRGLKGSWEWLALAAQVPAHPVMPVTGLATGLVAKGRWLYKGMSVVNTATTAGSVQLYDAEGGSGLLVDALAAAASSPARTGLVSDGVLCEIGMYVVVTGLAGTLVVWGVPLDWRPGTPPGD